MIKKLTFIALFLFFIIFLSRKDCFGVNFDWNETPLLLKWHPEKQVEKTFLKILKSQQGGEDSSESALIKKALKNQRNLFSLLKRLPMDFLKELPLYLDVPSLGRFALVNQTIYHLSKDTLNQYKKRCCSQNQRIRFKARLKYFPISTLPTLPDNELVGVITMVDHGDAFVLFNQYGQTRVFFDGNLPENLDTIRIVALSATSFPALLDDGEWNYYIKNALGEDVELSDTDLNYHRLIDYCNHNMKLKKNIHLLKM